MSRNPSVDWELIEKEYVYSEDHISFTDLANKHSVARSALAARADHGGWYEKRQEFNNRVTVRTAEALIAEWVPLETESRKKMMETAGKVLDRFAARLDDPEFKIDSRDAIGWVSVMRDLFKDVRDTARPGPIVEGEAIEMDEAAARRAIEFAQAHLDAAQHEDDDGAA